MVIEEARMDDVEALSMLDRHISAETVQDKVRRAEILVLRDGETIGGWLRYSYFWDEHPFMNMLCVLQAYRSLGLGKELVAHWEECMRAKGFLMVMTSTLSDESAQHFYRKLDYRDIGGFILPGEPLELMLAKWL